jgi:hypothetical protein
MCEQDEYRRRNSERDTRRKKPWLQRLKAAFTCTTGGLLPLFTFLLVVVGILQWCTFEKTDLTLKETLRASQLAQRAFVYFTNLDVRPNYFKKDTWVMVTRIENVGTTSAKLPSVEIGCKLSETELSEPFESIERKNLDRIPIAPKIPRDAPACEDVPIDRDLITKISDGRVYFYFTGKIAYNDIFDGTERHFTKLSYRVMRLWFSSFIPPGSPLPVRQLNSVARRAGSLKYNCSDQDCE